ncbi:MAG: RagB/SusD family nutrient uptake outer membrane protein, partial [Cytophagales bacterium]|nr:RagB/SusD family nutrient uptake outer membrane protein [Cytophagales bacterium]
KYVVGTPEDNGGVGGGMKTFINTNILRLADVYLMAAEAIMGTGGSTSDAKALEYYNRVRTRAGLPVKSTVAFDDLLKERRLEMAVEADYWFDLLRIDRAKAIQIISQQERGIYGDPFPTISSTKFTPKPDHQLDQVHAQRNRFPFPAAQLRGFQKPEAPRGTGSVPVLSKNCSKRPLAIRSWLLAFG